MQVEIKHSVYSKIEALEDDTILEEENNINGSLFNNITSYSSDNIISYPVITEYEDDMIEPFELVM